MKYFSVFISICILAGVVPAFGHHSFAAEYDSAKPVKLKGTFVKMDWVNPHSWIHMDVKEADGKIVGWKCEALPPNALFRGGWRRDSLKPGEEIIVEGFMAKDGTPTMWTRVVTNAEGRRMFAGTADQK